MNPTIIAMIAKMLLSNGKHKKSSKSSLPKPKVYNNAFTGMEFDDDVLNDNDF